MKQKNNRPGFTLIELLVVIAIIGILVALLLPVVSESIKSAETAKANSETKAIKAAIDGYYSTYGKLPSVSGNTAIIKSIIGEDNTDNPRKLVFLEIPTGDTSGAFLDPWGKQYQITLDTDYDNTVSYSGKTYKVTSIVVSTGPDGVAGGNDDLHSFD